MILARHDIDLAISHGTAGVTNAVHSAGPATVQPSVHLRRLAEQVADDRSQLGDAEATRAFGRAAGIFQRRLGTDQPRTEQARANLELLGGWVRAGSEARPRARETNAR